MIFAFDCPACGASDLEAEIGTDTFGQWDVVSDVDCDECGAVRSRQDIAEKFALEIDQARFESSYDEEP